MATFVLSPKQEYPLLVLLRKFKEGGGNEEFAHTVERISMNRQKHHLITDKMKIRVISFDMDGTLTDPRFADLVWNEGIPNLYAEKEGIDIEIAKEYIKKSYDDVGPHRIKWYDIDYWFSYFGLKGSWSDLLNEYKCEIMIYPEVPDVLDNLKRECDPIDLIISSNAARPFVDLESERIKHYFSHIFSSISDFGMKKTPEFYNLPSHIPSIDSSTSSLNIDLSHVDRREMGLRENN
jgi:hypothetical protein